MKGISCSRDSLSGMILAVLVIVVWGITFVSTKYLLKSFSALEILFVRYVIAYGVLWIMNPHEFKLDKKSDNMLFVLAGLTGIVLYQFSENTAISFTTASNVSIIVSVCPMFTAIFSQVILKEKHIGFFFVLGFAISIVGIALVSFNGRYVLKLNPRGDFLAMGAALCWGFYSLAVSKINSKNFNSILATRRTFFFADLMMIPMMVMGAVMGTDGTYASVSLDAQLNAARFSNIFNWMNFLFLGVGASALCFVAWTKACRMVGTVKTTLMIYLIPVVTVVFAWLCIGEKITSMGLAGCCVTIAGLFISNIGRKK